MDHKNLIQDALRLTSDQVYGWRLLLDKYGCKIVYIKGIHNSVPDIFSRLEYAPIQDNKTKWMMFVQYQYHYIMHVESAESAYIHQEQINLVVANCNKEDVMYQLTVREIEQAQQQVVNLNTLSKHDKFSSQLVEDTEVLCKKGKW